MQLHGFLGVHPTGAHIFRGQVTAMADPTFQSLCCLPTVDEIDSSTRRDLLLLHQTPYYGVSLASAFVGFVGSVYQVKSLYVFVVLSLCNYF